MPTRNVYLSSEQDSFVEDQIKAGDFQNASEVVRAGLRLLEEQRLHVQALRDAVLHGMNSGVAEGDVVGRLRQRIKERATAKESASA